METKTSKCIKLNQWGSPDDHGNYFYEIEFENGDKGNYKGNPSRLSFKVGEAREYTIEDATWKSGKTYKRIKKAEKKDQPHSNGQPYAPKPVDPEELSSQAASVAQTAAVNIFKVLNKIGVKRSEIDLLSDALHQWIIKNGLDNYKKCSLRWNAVLRIAPAFELFTEAYLRSIANDPQFVQVTTKAAIDLCEHFTQHLATMVKGGSNDLKY